ncbi:MAG TPA: glycosyltransferase [Planctomycetota bacterium]
MRGKFLAVGAQTLFVRGVTYGTFRPQHDGEYPLPDVVASDFAAMVANGINTVRTYTVPPRWLLDAAEDAGLRLLIGLPIDRYIGGLADGKETAASLAQRVRDGVRACAGHPAVLGYTIGNEIPAPVVRWHGRRKTERLLHRLYRAAKAADPDALVTYVNYPSTEYLQLPFLDFCAFNVYLEDEKKFDDYLARLQTIAQGRPLLLCELGLDSLRNGEEKQASTLAWQVRMAFDGGCAGAFVYAWTDEWYRSGEDVHDWAFGLVRRDRSPKPALGSVRASFADVPFSQAQHWPRFSVIVCTHNGRRWLRECLEGIARLDYPDYEVIVVDDGSRDDTAAIAAACGQRVISTPHQGLSSARNTGMRAATGEFVAYIDDDAHPDPLWLRHLALTFLRSTHAGVAGPNLAPPGDGWVAECIDNAPGNPTQVLLTDREAEHIPGCNMSFRRESLLAIGGFDTRFWAAGDDVDVCWQLQKHGFTLGFSPAAVVWHHRRGSVKAFWRQQFHYGKAEALLEEKWPEKYNAAGHHAWRGRIYDPRSELVSNLGRIYHGMWGSAPFQALYQPRWGPFALLPLMPEWYLLGMALLIVSLLGLWWTPLLFAVPLLLTVVGLTLAQCFGGAMRARFDVRRPASELRTMRTLTAWLHVMQPLARLLGRLRYGLTPWRRRRAGFALPRRVRRSIWTERGQSPSDWLLGLEAGTRAHGVTVRRGGDFDGWDLTLASGMLGRVRVVMAVEEHGGGRQLARLLAWPSWSLRAVVPATFGTLLAAGAALDGAWAVAAGGALLALVLAVRALLDCGGALRATLRAFAALAPAPAKAPAEPAP